MTNSKSAGFTLIELVIVIVILGVLAAVAAPRFIDLSQDAERSSLQAQASALESSSAINFAAAAASGARSAEDNDSVEVATCGDAANLLSSDLDDRFEILNEGDDLDDQSFGASNTCELGLADNTDIDNVEFTVIAVPGSP